VATQIAAFWAPRELWRADRSLPPRGSVPFYSNSTTHGRAPHPRFLPSARRTVPPPRTPTAPAGTPASNTANQPGRVKLFHATSSAAASSIQSSGVLLGGDYGQAWLGSTNEIAALHHAGGATPTASGETRAIEAIVEVAVAVDDLYFETTRDSDSGAIELFYLLDPGNGCSVQVCAVLPWP
jgi:hypothetical protein